MVRVHIDESRIDPRLCVVELVLDHALPYNELIGVDDQVPPDPVFVGGLMDTGQIRIFGGRKVVR